MTNPREVKGVKEVKTSARTTSVRWSPGSSDPGLTRVIVCFFTSLSLFTSLLAAQQVPVFRGRVDVVELDISVLDKNRRPVRGLTAADFRVFEDGKLQDISVFEAIDVPDPVPPPTAWMRDVTPDVTTNDVRVTRLWVLVVDDGMIPTDPFGITTSLKVAREIVDKFGPNDLATIVFTADSRKAQDFTNDRTKLLATLDQFNPGWANWAGPPAGDVNPDWQFQIGAVRTLRNVMDALVLVPHSRKALIWLSGGIPQSFQIAPKEVPKLTGLGPSQAGRLVQMDIVDRAKEVFEIGRRANVPVYPIHPCGLIAPFDMSKCGAPAAGIEFLETTALNTGGHAIVNTNDYTPGINSIFEENKSYYLIGYNPSNTKTDGTLRRLEVKVNREDVDVRTRSSYYAPKPGDGPPKNTNDALVRATAAPIPVAELPLRATVAPFAIPGGRNAAVAIALGVRQPVPEGAAKERVTVTTELRTSAFNTEGDQKGTQRHTAKVVLRAGAQGDADYEALSRIDLPAGRYRLRLAVFHESSGKTGTVNVDVVVPDFNADAASMSGVVLGATPGRPSAPRDLLTNILPLIPTAQRAFAKTDRATALFYLYQHAGKTMTPAQVAIRVTDSHGAVLITDAQTVAVDRFIAAQSQAEARPTTPTMGGTKSIPTIGAGAPPRNPNATLRAAEFQYLLPIARLSAGPYLLTFETTMGTTNLRRDVQFEVK